MSTRATLVLLTTAGMLAGANANAASFSTMPTIHSAPRLNLSVTSGVATTSPVVPITTTDHRPPCHYGYGYGCTGLPAPPAVGPHYPRLTIGPTNDQFDTTGNLNPGGGGGGVKPGKKPNAQ